MKFTKNTYQVLARRIIVLISATLFFNILVAHAEPADTVFKKNEVAVSLNTPLFVGLGHERNDDDRDLAVFYTSRLNPHWAFRLGAGYRKSLWGAYLPHSETEPVSWNYGTNEQTWAKAGMVRYTRGRLLKAYYGIDFGYLSLNDNTAEYVMQHNSASYKWDTMHSSTHLESIRGIVASPVFGLRVEINRHFALAAECSPEVYFGRYKVNASWVDAAGQYHKARESTGRELNTNTVPILTRFNLIYKF